MVEVTSAPKTVVRIDLSGVPDFTLDGLNIAPARRVIRLGDAEAQLEPLTMRVLVALAKSEGRVVSKKELLNACWDGRTVGDDAIHKAIAKVRALSATFDVFAVQTFPRVGVMLTLRSHVQEYEKSRVAKTSRFYYPIITKILRITNALSFVLFAILIIFVFSIILPRVVHSDQMGSIVWNYNLGKRSDAPNGLRFWNTTPDGSWTESFADGSVRSRFKPLGNYYLKSINCSGRLLRRGRDFLAFVPSQKCNKLVIMGEDINAVTGEVTKPWFVLGPIESFQTH